MASTLVSTKILLPGVTLHNRRSTVPCSSLSKLILAPLNHNYFSLVSPLRSSVNRGFVAKGQGLHTYKASQLIANNRRDCSLQRCSSTSVGYKNLSDIPGLSQLLETISMAGRFFNVSFSPMSRSRTAMIELVCCALLLFAVTFPGNSAAAEGEYISQPLPSVVADTEYVRAGARPDVLLSDFEADKLTASPDQVHITLAGPNRMKVSWVTNDFSAPSYVEYGTAKGNYTSKATGDSLSYKYIGYKSGLIHHVVLGADIPLEDDTVYYYRCGGLGDEYSFKTPPPLGADTVKFAIVGDLGQTGWSVSTLEHIQQSSHDLLLLVGDLSYADRYQPRWDTWGRLIEPLASSRPWMVVEGNHEIENIWGLEPPFKAYNARWPMPYEESGSKSNLYYSFDVANVHFIMLGSYANYSEGSEQYEWLQADLAKVDRSRTPWLIAALHAPWYNSNSVHQGEGDEMMASMEDLLFEANVDFLFAGHVHAYERATRVYKGVPNPCGVIHVTIGDGGNREGLATRYLEPTPEWSIKREASFGHGELEIVNGTTAHWTWHRNQDDESVVADEVWVRTLGDPNNECSVKEAQRQE